MFVNAPARTLFLAYRLDARAIAAELLHGL